MKVRLGAHLSMAEGFPNVILTAEWMHHSAVSIFLSSPRNYWPKRPTPSDTGDRFRSLAVEADVLTVAHAPYLINLCQPDNQKRTLSVKSIMRHLWECDTMGVSYLVTHVGSHMGKGMDFARFLLKESLEQIAACSKPVVNGRVSLLLENSAGGGTSVAGDIDFLHEVIDEIGCDYIGLCLDAAHAFGAGYLFDEKELPKILKHKYPVIHLNRPDPEVVVGNHLDRHDSPFGDDELSQQILSLIDSYSDSVFILERSTSENIISDTKRILKRVNGYHDKMPWCKGDCKAYVRVGPDGLCRL